MFSIRVLKRRDGFTLDVAIEAAERGVIALFGRSGCGKTTLINIIAGLLDADEARISIGGVVMKFNFTGQRSLAASERRAKAPGTLFKIRPLTPHGTSPSGWGKYLWITSSASRATDSRNRAAR